MYGIQKKNRAPMKQTEKQTRRKKTFLTIVLIAVSIFVHDFGHFQVDVNIKTFLKDYPLMVMPFLHPTAMQGMISFVIEFSDDVIDLLKTVAHHLLGLQSEY